MRVPIPVVGPTYNSRSKPLSAQITRNLYPEIDQEARSVVAFHGTPGLTLKASTNGAANRGATVHNGELYTVAGTELYKVSSSWTATSLGTVAGGTGQCEFDTDGTNLLIATGSTPYLYNGSTVSVHPSANVGTPNSFSYLNQRFWLDADDGGILLTDLDDPTTIQNTQASPDATAESQPDDNVRIYPFKQVQYVFGTKTIEQWWNRGTGIPPIARVNNAVIPVGLGAEHSVSSNRNYVYFLDHTQQPQRLNGLSAEPIGNPALGDQWRTYAKWDDAQGVCWSWGHQYFYGVTFPSADKTWVFHEQSGEWFELAYGVNGDRHLMNDYVWVYDKHVVLDYRTSKVYEWDFDTFTDNGDVIQRHRDTASVHGGLFDPSLRGRKIFMSRFELIMETGVGTSSGQGLTPQVMLSWSDDGGRSFGQEVRADMGRAGEYVLLEWYNLGSFYERIFRIKISDPVKTTIIAANADIEVGL